MIKKTGQRVLGRKSKTPSAILVSCPDENDKNLILRICRDELGEKAVEITTMPHNYPNDELSMAKRVAKIVGINHILNKYEEKAVGPTDSSKDHRIRQKLRTLIDVYKEKKSRKKSKSKCFETAKSVLEKIGAKKSFIIVEGKTTYICGNNREMSKILKKFAMIKKKLNALGFSNVVLKPVS